MDLVNTSTWFHVTCGVSDFANKAHYTAMSDTNIREGKPFSQSQVNIGSSNNGVD